MHERVCVFEMLVGTKDMYTVFFFGKLIFEFGFTRIIIFYNVWTVLFVPYSWMESFDSPVGFIYDL